VKVGRFDLVVWGTLGALAMMLAGLVLASDHVGAQVTATSPAAGGETPGLAPITVTFAQPMQADSVSERFRIEPAIAGRVEWAGAVMRFVPSAPLEPGVTYTARLEAGALSTAGRALKRAVEWSFTVRKPSIVYVAPATGGPRNCRVDAAGATPAVQLTLTGGKVFDFAVAPDSSQLLYSAVNEQGGMDLWRLPLDGSTPATLFVDCGPDRCTVPAWAPDGTRVAFSREEEGLSPNSPLGPPRVWSVNVPGGEAAALYLDSQVLGYGPVWSPDGSRLAFFDGGAGGSARP
jgi:hypothetical protein